MVDQRFSRQISTVVSIDAVGFSRLMHVDDEAALSVFDERRTTIIDTVKSSGGHIFGAAGDSIMAEFGDPIFALRSAFAFQDAIAELNRNTDAKTSMDFRVGINTGPVMVRSDGIYGDCVNIAARIQEFAPHSGLAISETTYQHVKDKLDAEFTDFGQFQLKNIPLPVRVYLASRTASPTSLAGLRDRVVASEDTATSDREPAIAVLPFQNLTGDASLDYVCDGIADDIIYGLANTRSVPVIASESSFQFREQTLGAATIGKLLGVRYVVTGKVSGTADGLRLNASLTDSTNSRVVWAGRFERALKGVQGLQVDLGGEIVSILEKEVDRVEQIRTFQVPWESLATWQLVRRGRWHMQRRTSTDTALALHFFEQAYAEDANSTSVLNELSWWYLWRAWLHFADADDLARVADYAQRAHLMDSRDARPYANLGFVEILKGRPQAAVDFLLEAVEINPSDSLTHTALGSSYGLLLRPDDAIPQLQEAMRLNPFETYRFHNLGELAAAHTVAENWDAVIAAADRSLSFAPDYFYARLLKIGALVRKGNLEEASRERAIFDMRHPHFQHSWVDWIPFADKAVNRRMIERFELARGSTALRAAV